MEHFDKYLIYGYFKAWHYDIGENIMKATYLKTSDMSNTGTKLEKRRLRVQRPGLRFTISLTITHVWLTAQLMTS